MSASSLTIEGIEHEERRNRFLIHCTLNDQKYERYEFFFFHGTLREFALDFLARKKPTAKELLCAFKSTQILQQKKEIIARFITWAWRAVKSYQPLRGVKREKLFGELKDLIPHATAFELMFNDTGAIFTLRPNSPLSFSIVLPLDPEDFVAVFRQWWRAAEEDMRLITEDLWKYLHETNPVLTPSQKEQLGTCFIQALNQEEFRHLQEEPNLSWHYCYWHKLRWQATQQLVDETKLEQAAVEWLSVCYRTEPTEPAIATEFDPEKEIRKVLFDGGRRVPTLLQSREREKQTLFRLAQWFMHRYDLSTAFQIVGLTYRLACLILWLIAIGLPVLSVLALRQVNLNPMIVITLFIASAVILGSICFWDRLESIQKVTRLAGRLTGGCVIGWLPLFTEEFWRFALTNPIEHQWMNFVPIGISLTVFSYLILEARRFLPKEAVSKKELLRRSGKVVLLGLPISAVVGVFVSQVGALAILPGIMGEIQYACPAPLLVFFLPFCQGLYGSISELMVFPLAVLIIHTPLALLVGAFVQLLWEEKPMTEPL